MSAVILQTDLPWEMTVSRFASSHYWIVENAPGKNNSFFLKLLNWFQKDIGNKFVGHYDQAESIRKYCFGDPAH